jgi:presqualene diphosphate synthase
MTAEIAQSPPPAVERASRSSFYTAMRIMPRGQREAMYEIYSFCRAVDDIADDPGPREGRLTALQRWRTDIDALYARRVRPELATLAVAVDQFKLEREDFQAIIDGMEMDVVTTIRAPDLATLAVYCDRVACAVGRLSVRVFGMEREPGFALSDHLGRALQLTNILRDLDEDAEMGRLYLPREALREAGITESEPVAVLASPAVGKACAPVVASAKAHFREAEAIMAASRRATVRTPRVMAAAYGSMLDAMVARGWQAPRTPVRLRKSQLIWIVLRYAIL